MNLLDIQLDMIQTDTIYLLIIGIIFVVGLYFIANTFQKAKNARLKQKEAEQSGNPTAPELAKSIRKMMIKDIIVGVILITLAALFLPISPAKYARGQAMCDAYMRKYAKFPESLQIHFLSCTMEGDTVKWSVSYSAKNVFGMRLNDTAYLKTYDRTLEDIDGHTYDFNDLKSHMPMVDRAKITLSALSFLRDY